MTAQLKERIIGIVVLIFLALIIVPWIVSSDDQPLIFPKETLPKKERPSITYLPTIPKEPIQGSVAQVEQEMDVSKLSHIENTERKSSIAPLKLHKPNSTKIKLRIAPPLPPKATDRGLAIQLGCFDSKLNANNLMKELKARGYPVILKTSNTLGKQTTRVFVGPEYNRQSAIATIKKIEKTFKVHGVITKMNI
jgi:cell division septation protein DedD